MRRTHGLGMVGTTKRMPKGRGFVQADFTAAVLAPGTPEAWWDMSDTDTQISDISGNGVHLTSLFNSPDLSVANAVGVDGTNGIYGPTPAGWKANRSSLTFITFFNTTEAVVGIDCIASVVPTRHNYQADVLTLGMYTASGNVTAQVGTNADSSWHFFNSTASGLIDGKWHMIAFRVNSTAATLFVDGQVDLDTTINGAVDLVDQP